MKLTLQEMRYALADKPEFRFTEYEGMTVGCYMIAGPETFATEWGRECRGVTFDAEGRCIGRPLPKFFNVNERPETQADAIDWSKLKHVYEKRDGSLIHTVKCSGGYRLKTKKSFTAPQAVAAQAYIDQHPVFHGWLHAVVDAGFTVIMEWTAPDNRVVVAYPVPQLTVLHVRDNTTGNFVTRERLEDSAEVFDIPLVDVLFDKSLYTQETMMRLAKHSELTEGWVLQFEDGTLLKLKTQWYLDRHHYMTELRERDVARATLDETLDDIKSKIPAEDTVTHDNILRVERVVVDEIEALIEQTEAAHVRWEWHSAKDTAIALREHPLFTLIMAKKNGKEPHYKRYYEKYLLDQRWGLELVTTFGSRSESLP